MGTNRSTARFIKLDGKGKKLPESAQAWSAVLERLHANGDPRLSPIVWDADVHGQFTAAQHDEFLKTHTVCGKPAAAPGIVDLFELAPRDKAEEAEYAKYFRGERNWCRSAKPYAPGPDDRWGVSFDGGYSGNLYDSRVYFVRAVRASQSIGPRPSLRSGKKS